MINATFFMEQHLGHRTYYESLRKYLSHNSLMAASWVPVTYSVPEFFWANWKIIPGRIRGPLQGFLEIRRGLKNYPADILFFNTQAPAALAYRMLRNKKYALSTDITPVQYDDMADEYNHTADGDSFIARLKHEINVKLMQNAALHFPWSSWNRVSLINDYQVPEEKIFVVPPGVDLDIWKPVTKKKTSPMRIIFVGGDFHRKGGPFLLEAFHNLPLTSAELHLVTRTKIEATQHINVYNYMQPNSPDLIQLVQSCDLFVLPTKAEAFGIAAVEASAAGLPIIVTAKGGITEIVAHEENGFIVESGNVEELTKYLTLFANQPELRAAMGAASRQRAEIKFNAQTNAEFIAKKMYAAAMQRLLE
jgi:glycosyltransferase involved in cell wall biosynthesis